MLRQTLFADRQEVVPEDLINQSDWIKEGDDTIVLDGQRCRLAVAHGDNRDRPRPVLPQPVLDGIGQNLVEDKAER